MIDFFILYKKAFIDIVTIWFLAVVMPGPDMFLVISSSIQKGKKYALSCVGGIVAGTLIWLIVGFFLIGILVKTSFFFYVKIFGGCYLIYMAFRIILSLKKKNTSFDNIQIRQDGIVRGFFNGLLTNLSNPKAPLFVSVVLTPIPSQTPLENILFLFVIMLAIPSIWFSGVVYFFRIKRILQVFLQYSRWLDVFAILVFGSVGVGLLLEM